MKLTHTHKKVITILVVLLAPLSLACATGNEAPFFSQQMMLLVVQLGVVLLVARLSSLLFERFNIPGILGALIAGIIIGPYFLGSIPFYGFLQGLFPLQSNFPVSPELYGFTAIGGVILFLMVGMETDLNLFLRYSFNGGIIGLAGAIFSFLVGDFTASFLFSLSTGDSINLLSPLALFSGSVATATSVGITARILSVKKKLVSPEGVTMIASAVIDNVFSVVLLMVVLGIISTSRETGHVNWLSLAVLTGKVAGLGLFILLVGVLLSHLNKNVLKFFKTRANLALLGLGLSLLVAGLIEEAGLSMMIGAYVMGLVLARTDLAHVIQEKLHPLYDFTVPVFFTIIGMLVNIRTLANPYLLLFGLVFTVAVVLAKVVGCGLPAFLGNFNFRGALRIACGMIPRGEIALIIASIGFAFGVVSTPVFSLALMMIFLTTIIAPSLLSWLLDNKSGLKKQVGAVAEEKAITVDFPSLHLTDFIFKRLFELFGSESFYIYRVDTDRNFFQIRKDEMSIGLKREEKKITFICNPEDENFVHTTLFMLMGETEQVIKGLLVPFDKKIITEKLPGNAAPKKQSFDVARYLRPELINLHLKGHNKEDVMEEMIDFLCKGHGINDKNAVEEAVWTREISMSTGMQHGIAIPHGKTDAVGHLACAIGIIKDGVDFDSLDGLLTRIIIMTVFAKQFTGSTCAIYFGNWSGADGRKFTLDFKIELQRGYLFVVRR